MSVNAETFLARIYVDERMREQFLVDPVSVAVAFGLDHESALRLAGIDRQGLRLAAESFRRKAESKKRKSETVAAPARAPQGFLISAFRFLPWLMTKIIPGRHGHH